jgi:hypothetical protein
MNFSVMARTVCLVVAFAALASAQIDVKAYRQPRNTAEQKTMRTYLAGAGEALATSNAKLVAKHQAVLYCAPETMTLNIDNMFSIVDDWIKKMLNGNTQEDLDKLPIVAVLLEGLMDTFPCPQKP